MEARITFHDTPKGFMETLFKVGGYIHNSGLDYKLHELINYRVSQINGCAFCLDMHSKDAIAAGESQQRLHGLAAWRETPYFSPAERAALAFAEELTQQCDVSDETYSDVADYFSKPEIANLALAVSTINTWNRLNKAFKTVAGGYVPGSYKVSV